MLKRRGQPLTAAEIDWEPMADGRPWRLKRGKDFDGETRRVQRAARQHAKATERAVVTMRDQSGKWDYVWVQFADYDLPEGEPCPRCGGTEMVREAKSFARCLTCQATMILEEPLLEEDHSEDKPAEGPPGEEPARRQGGTSEYGEIISSRLLSEDGEEIDTVGVDDEAVIEVLYRFAMPGLGVSATLSLWTDGLKVFRWPHHFTVEEAGVHRVAVRLPAGLLSQRGYSVDVSARLRLKDHQVRIHLRGSPAFAIHGVEDDRSRADGILRPDLEWEFTRLSAAGSAAAPSPGGASAAAG